MKIYPDTPVIVEWYTYRFIPRQRHAVMVPYSLACEWYHEGAAMECRAIDTRLYKELFHERGSKTY